MNDVLCSINATLNPILPMNGHFGTMNIKIGFEFQY